MIIYQLTILNNIKSFRKLKYYYLLVFFIFDLTKLKDIKDEF